MLSKLSDLNSSAILTNLWPFRPSQLPMSFMDGPLLHVARKTNGFDLRGDLSLGDGQGVLKMVAVTYSKKASNWRRDKELCSVSKGLILGIPTDKTETKLKEQIQRKPTTLCTWHNAMGGFRSFLFQTPRYHSIKSFKKNLRNPKNLPFQTNYWTLV